jgi:apolipoprotein N-acyltransferase
MTTAELSASEKQRIEVPNSASPPRSWIFLLSAAVLLLFADGRNTVSLAAWLAPLCLLRFVRTQSLIRGTAIAYAVLVVTRGITFRGMTPIPGIFYDIFLLFSSISALLPYFADRLLAPRLKGVRGTFVFPTVLVVTQFVYSHGPFGSWGSIAYTQSGNLPLLQLLSVTGLWGIVFLIGWFAAATNQLLAEGVRAPQAWRGVTLFAGVYLAVVMLGGARLALFPPASPTVRVASLSPAKTGIGVAEVLDAVVAGRATDAEIGRFNAATAGTQDELLARSEREARAGAKIVFWSEEAAFVLKDHEADLLARGRGLAEKYNIYLGMALAVWTPKEKHPLENKIVLIAPTGQIAWQYFKARPTPGPEMAMAVASDGKLRVMNTAYGQLSAAICYDTDFPSFMKQAGALRTGILLSPAGDWRAIDPRHTEIASFRAIEQGFNLVRQANNGLSAAYDYQGRRLASMDEFQSTDLSLISQVPMEGVRTIYSRLGDWFAWTCCAGLVGLIGLAWRSRRA